MKTLVISKDSELIGMANAFAANSGDELSAFNKSTKPLDIVADIFENNPSLIILDDDFVSPESENVLSNIRKMKKETKVIFVTSDSGIELGKKISQLGIYFYFLKPVSKSEFNELLFSINKSKEIISAISH